MVLLLFGGGIGDEEDVTDADEGGCGGSWVVFVVIVVDAVGRTIRGAEGGEIDDGGGGCGCTAAMLPLWNVTIVEILCGRGTPPFLMNLKMPLVSSTETL